MSTVFVGGSRQISRLPSQVKERLDNVRSQGFRVFVGDANGVDKAVQKYLVDSGHADVTVFCSGPNCRNNLGNWSTERVEAPKSAKGFQFYAAKDRAMARGADFGFMIWDGNSPGTVLNVLRLVRAGKKALLFNVPARRATIFKAAADWDAFLSQVSEELRSALRERATDEEWQGQAASDQRDMLETLDELPEDIASHPSESELQVAMNDALASGDPKVIVKVLGDLARFRGMSQLARDTGLAREGLYRALSAEGNPEFSTVIKVMNAMGFQLATRKTAA